MRARKFNIVTDGAWGSCGKGLITSALAAKYRPHILSTTNMANAGHTAVNTDGTPFVAKALPSASILNTWIKDYSPHVVVGPTAAFNLEQLQREIHVCRLNYSLSIHPRAGVITETHRLREAAPKEWVDGRGTAADSTKHIASTMQGCGTFLSDKILRKSDLRLAKDYPELSGFLSNHLPHKLDLPTDDQNKLIELSFPEMLSQLMVLYGYTILHEGSQGFSLDINHGSHYPHCTSRSTTAVQNMADMGINHFSLGDIYLVIRPYPIRVGNVIEDGKTIGYSGDCYEGQEEISWERVAKEAGMPTAEAETLLTKELTTVTKRLRRVFTFSDRQLREAALVNGATKIALNFANYIDWSVYGTNDYYKLSQKVKDFIVRVEDVAKIPVTVVGTGPRLDHVCFI
jgi:adenylosuccinate synthase